MKLLERFKYIFCYQLVNRENTNVIFERELEGKKIRAILSFFNYFNIYLWIRKG